MVNQELNRAIQKLQDEASKESALLHAKETELKKAEDEIKSAEDIIKRNKNEIPRLRREIDAIKVKQRVHFAEMDKVRTQFGKDIHDPKNIKLN